MPLQFLSPIHKASRQIALFLEAGLDRRDLSTREGHLLTYLRSYAPCPIGELHRVFGLRRSTLTSILDRLEDRRFLTRRLHPTDRRSFLIELTPAGRRLAKNVQIELDALEARIQRGVSRSAIRGFEQVMAAIAAATQVEVRERRE